MLNIIFYSPKDNYYLYSELNNCIFLKKGIKIFMANSPNFLFNIIDVDSKIILFDFQNQDKWLEYSITKRIGKDLVFLYYDINNNNFIDYNFNKKYSITDIGTLLENKVAYLKETSELYMNKIRNLLDDLNLVSYKLNSILLAKILLKMLVRNITHLKELDLSLICDDLGYDNKLISKRLGDYVKTWFKENQTFVCNTYPIFRALDSTNIKNFLSMFIFCLYEKLYRSEGSGLNAKFNLEYQTTMFD